MNTRSTASCYLERAIYVVVFIGLILCLVGCGRQSVYSEGIRASTAAAGVPVQSDPDRIHANHDHGADPNAGVHGFKSEQEYYDYRALIRQWGLKQIPDWLAVCNQVNVPALRRVGFDPQKDLDNRQGGDEKFNCYWVKPRNELSLLFGKTDDVNRIRKESKFHYTNTVTRDGHTYYLGHIEFVGEGTFVRTFSCSVTFERSGVAYMASFIGRAPKTHDQACNDLIAMMSPRK